MSQPTTTTPAYATDVRFDRELGDYALYIDGQFVGSARSEGEGLVVVARIAREQAQADAAAQTADEAPAAPAATRVTISAEPRKRRVQITRFAGLTSLRSRTYYGVTPASFARLARLTGGANFTELAA